MNTPPIPKWAPRLARLYSADIRRLEAVHADRISPGAATWEQAIRELFQCVGKAGPRKGSRLLGQVAKYLDSVAHEQRAYIVLGGIGERRNATLVLATFSVGNHPDAALREEGLNVLVHILQCARSGSRCLAGVPVAFIAGHALKRLFERGYDITENIHATSAFSYVAVLGFVVHYCERLADSGMHLRISDLLLAGGMHRFMRTCPNGRQHEERIFDVRTCLLVDELLGPARKSQLDQGEIAAAAVLGWFKEGDDVGERALAARIPFLPKRDSYPAQVAAARR